MMKRDGGQVPATQLEMDNHTTDWRRMGDAQSFPLSSNLHVSLPLIAEHWYMADQASNNISPAEFQSELNVNAYIALICLTLLFYDYILTADQEIQAYWGARITWATALFYLNRYVSMIGNAVAIIPGNLWTTKSPRVETCRAVQTYHQYFSIIAQIFVAALLIMRTYALYERSRRILFLTTGIALSAVIVGAAILYSGKSNSSDLSDVSKTGCASSLTVSESRRLGFAWMGMLVFDVTIFVLTAAKALALSREQRGGLFLLLIRDGSLYFLVMVASNCANILTFFYAGPYTRGVATTFTNVISSVMISRLMLNLRLHATDTPPLRTGESTTLYDAPISTVVEPYYATSDYNFARSAVSSPADGRFDDNDISLEELRTVHREP
ncbi:hypothetical protein B0H19DRAFT_1372569 [Mycena capillaripes]|nr:hypothetical protein B0H19DRAFT_1372569 [Mycena capillaripes]